MMNIKSMFTLFLTFLLFLSGCTISTPSTSNQNIETTPQPAQELTVEEEKNVQEIKTETDDVQAVDQALDAIDDSLEALDSDTLDGSDLTETSLGM